MKCEYFDYLSYAEQAGISDTDLEKLYQKTLAEYLGDQNLGELRLMRTCKAIANGRLTIEEALKPEPDPRDDTQAA
jgi:hypothetical protein